MPKSGLAVLGFANSRFTCNAPSFCDLMEEFQCEVAVARRRSSRMQQRSGATASDKASERTTLARAVEKSSEKSNINFIRFPMIAPDTVRQTVLSKHGLPSALLYRLHSNSLAPEASGALHSGFGCQTLRLRPLSESPPF